MGSGQLLLPIMKHQHIYVYPMAEGREMKVTGYCKVCGEPKESVSNYGLQEALYCSQNYTGVNNKTNLNKMLQRCKVR
jgi:hypothetical protein